MNGDALPVPPAGEETISTYALSVATLCVRGMADDGVNLPPMAGSALRGAFGHALRLTGCVRRSQGGCHDTCAENAEAEATRRATRCPYGYIFETPHPPGAPLLEQQKEVPHPYIIRPLPTTAGTHAAGAWLEYEITLVGKALDHTQVVVEACVVMGRLGLGAGHGTVSVCELWECEPFGGTRRVLPFSNPGLSLSAGWEEAVAQATLLPRERLTIQFLTPTHLVRHGQKLRRPDFSSLMRALLRRMTMLAVYHGGGVDRAQMALLAEQAEAVQLANWEGNWQEWQRYSSRQDKKMTFQGLVGDALYEGDLAPFLPYLVMGQALHVGKACTFGEGHYRLLTDSPTIG